MLFQAISLWGDVCVWPSGKLIKSEPVFERMDWTSSSYPENRIIGFFYRDLGLPISKQILTFGSMQKMNLKHIHFEFQPNFGALNVDGLSSTKIFRGWFFFLATMIHPWLLQNTRFSSLAWGILFFLISASGSVATGIFFFHHRFLKFIDLEKASVSWIPLLTIHVERVQKRYQWLEL